MIDLSELDSEIPEFRVAATGHPALPCLEHNRDMVLTVVDDRVTAKMPHCGCSADALLARYAERSPRLAGWLKSGSNGNGWKPWPYEMGETGHGQKVLWQSRIVRWAHEILKADPEYHKGHLQLEDIVAPLQAEIMGGLHSDASVFAVYKPPDWMDDEEQWKAIPLAIEAAWTEFKEKERNDLIVANGITPSAALIELPDLTRKELEPLTWGQMRKRRLTRHREWVVAGKLARGETSSWSGKVEGGKTTLMRELTLCGLRGHDFLGCATMRGRVAYVMLDADGEDVTFDAFEEMGFDDEDGKECLFIFETMLAQMDRGLERLVKMLMDFKPILVIVDPYPRLKMIEDFHSYTNTYLMGLLSYVARMVNAHLALPGHIPRGRDDDADVATAGFGSIAFSGGVNARFTVTNRNGTHTIRSSQGKGAGFEPFDAEYVLQQDAVTKRISLGQPWSWKDKARSYIERVVEFLDDHADRPFDVLTLAKEIRVQRSVIRTAANMAFGQQRVRRTGDGLKSDPFIFASLGYGGPMTIDEVKRG